MAKIKNAGKSTGWNIENNGARNVNGRKLAADLAIEDDKFNNFFVYFS